MKNRSEIDFFIGIDAGKHTGLAIWDNRLKKLIEVKTLLIHRAMDLVRHYQVLNLNRIHVIVEDARMATYGRGTKEEMVKLKGAGSICRDCTIWEDFLQDWNADFTMRRPNKNITKFSEDTFIKITGWMGRTSNHARDAAFLIYQIGKQRIWDS